MISTMEDSSGNQHKAMICLMIAVGVFDRVVTGMVSAVSTLHTIASAFVTTITSCLVLDAQVCRSATCELSIPPWVTTRRELERCLAA
jgi:hypothetical protein